MLKRSTGDPAWDAWQFTGVDCLYPPWFDRMVFHGAAQKASVLMPLSVKIITGAWVVVQPGEWVVLHRGWDLWTMTDEDFHRAYEEY